MSRKFRYKEHKQKYIEGMDGFQNKNENIDCLKIIINCYRIQLWIQLVTNNNVKKTMKWTNWQHKTNELNQLNIDLMFNNKIKCDKIF